MHCASFAVRWLDLAFSCRLLADASSLGHKISLWCQHLPAYLFARAVHWAPVHCTATSSSPAKISSRHRGRSKSLSIRRAMLRMVVATAPSDSMLDPQVILWRKIVVWIWALKLAMQDLQLFVMNSGELEQWSLDDRAVAGRSIESNSLGMIRSRGFRAAGRCIESSRSKDCQGEEDTSWTPEGSKMVNNEETWEHLF